MQDNRIDDQFLDNAWQQMSAMLDQEMPVAQKKRRFAWWFWPSASAALLLLAWWFWGTYDVQYFPIPGLGASQPVALEEIEVPSEQHLAKAETSERETSNSSEASGLPLRQIGQGEAASDTNKSTSLAELSTPINSLSNAAISLSANDAPSEKQPNVQSTQESNGKQTISTIPVFAMLPSLEISPLFAKPHNSFIECNTRFNEPSKWSFLAEAGGIAGNGDYLTGLYAGAEVDFAFANNRKWQLISGLRVNYMRTNAIPEQSSTFVSDVLTNGGSIGTNADPTQESFDLDTLDIVGVSLEDYSNDLLQLEIPLLIEYQVAPRWSIQIGGYVNRVLLARENTDYLLATLNELSGTTSNVLYNRQSEITEPILNSWNYGLEGGIRFHISKHWKVHAFGSWGLKNFYETDARNERRRTVQLGIQYQIGR